MDGVSAEEISVVANSWESPYDFIRGPFKWAGGAAKTGLGLLLVLGLGAIAWVGTIVWGERELAGKKTSAASSRLERFKGLVSCFGVEGEVEPESDSLSELSSLVVHIVDRD